MANITLKLAGELLMKVKKLAFEHNTSVNAIVNEKLKEYVAAHDKKKEVLAGLDAFYKRIRASRGQATWSRDQLHER